MQNLTTNSSPAPLTAAAPPAGKAHYAGWILLAILALLLWGPEVGTLWHLWQSDSALSHGPLVPVITAGLLWMRREDLKTWNAASGGGLAFLGGSTLLYIAAIWADVEFLTPLSLAGMAAGALWFLGGWKAFTASVGALGFLAFMIPWPTTFIDRVAFPLQLMSTSYAGLFSGILGVPVHRDGVQLAVISEVTQKPIYSIVVAQKCSGLTSLMVLLALGYLIAYHTPLRLGWRALMMAAIIPLTLFTNSVRLTLILMAGAHQSAKFAQWVHDNEGPVLILFCSFGLLALRQGLLNWTGAAKAASSSAVSKDAGKDKPDDADGSSADMSSEETSVETEGKRKEASLDPVPMVHR